MLTFYFICVLVGLIFAVLSFIFSGGFEANVDIAADVGADAGGDFGHDVTGGDVGVGDVHFPLFSPVVLACFVTAFGGGGIIGLKMFPFMPILSLLFAIGSGLLVGLLVGFIVMKIFTALQVNAITTARSLIGSVAEVTEIIGAAGVGQISFSGRQGRVSGPARSEENKDIGRHAMVTITRVVGGLYYVREHVDEKLRNVPEAKEDKTSKKDKK
ncbi:MAG: hypothetical protein JRJ87_07135 [Deltaproteobacteria bacterium]|nr:hypothetical protein [Deltaproteobacteria bacterium]